MNECNLKQDICHTGTCTNTPGSYHCSCPLGTYGKQCDILGTCDSHPCQNGGSCQSQNKTITCKCQHGFTGQKCETRPNQKTTLITTTMTTTRVKSCQNDCSHHGSCHNGRCTCDPKWVGDDCPNTIIASVIHVNTTQSV